MCSADALFARYCRRYDVVGSPAVVSPADRSTRLWVVIPAYREEELQVPLESLARCDPPECAVEVLYVLNYPEGDEEGGRLARRGWRLLRKKRKELPSWLRVHALLWCGVRRGRSGAGYARKVGADQALYRAFGIGVLDKSAILFLDADCRVSRGYLRVAYSLLRRFDLVHFGFRHRVRDEAWRRVTDLYELRLRYYRWGLRWSGVPWATYTIGSCLGVRMEAYMRWGGLSLRHQAGEDFYFVHKLLPYVSFCEGPVCVFPEGRPSLRVPFGTGRALVGGGVEWFIPFEAFVQLRRVYQSLPYWVECPEEWRRLPGLALEFGGRSFWVRLARSLSGRYERALFQAVCSLSGLWVWRFLRWVTERRYGYALVVSASRRLLGELGGWGEGCGLVESCEDLEGLVNAFCLLDQRYPVVKRSVRALREEWWGSAQLGRPIQRRSVCPR